MRGREVEAGAAWLLDRTEKWSWSELGASWKIDGEDLHSRTFGNIRERSGTFEKKTLARMMNMEDLSCGVLLQRRTRLRRLWEKVFKGVKTLWKGFREGLQHTHGKQEKRDYGT